MKFFQNATTGEWIVGLLTIPEGTCLKEVNEATGQVRIESVSSGRTFADLLSTEYQKENGDNYANLVEFEAATKSFFSPAYYQKSRLVDPNGTTTFPSGKPVVLTGSVTLPANASSYAINDAVNNSASAPTAISFDVDAALANGGGGIIGLVKIEAPSQFAGKQLNVMVYKEAPTAIQNDNAPFILSSANTAKRIACLPVLMDSAIDSSLICYGQAQFALPYQCLSTAKNLKALLYTSDAVTSPTQSGVITIAVTTIQIA